MQPTENDALAEAEWSETFRSPTPASSTLPALLIAASVLLDLAVLNWHTPMTSFPTASGLAYLALAFSQISLVTIWASLASAHVILRLLILASVSSIMTAALMRFEPAGHGWIILVGIQLLALGGPLVLLRLSGTRFFVQAGRNRDDSGNRAGVQFSLRHLFVATTVIAIVLGILRTSEFRGRDVVIFCSMGLLFAAIGWISTWSVFGSHDWRQRLGVLLVFGALLGGFIAGLVTRGQPIFMLSHALLYLAQSLLLAGSLLVLRTAGYRLETDRDPLTAPRP